MKWDKNEWSSLENGFGIKRFPSVNHVPRLVPDMQSLLMGRTCDF
jgi:hypothetical protein